MPLAGIGTSEVRAALAAWDGMATQGKIRTKIKSVIDFATASEWFTGANPAAYATMSKLLPAAAKAEHHAAMLASDVPAFVAGLRNFNTPAARALQFLIQTAARSAEASGATWAEIQGDVWSIAGDRMKEKRGHAVPLTPQAIALLGTRGAPGDLIFFKSSDSKEARGDAMRAFVEDRPDASVHGFRSTFTDWAAENGYPSELRELALAHAVGDSTERAYHRSNRLARRRSGRVRASSGDQSA